MFGFNPVIEPNLRFKSLDCQVTTAGDQSDSLGEYIGSIDFIGEGFFRQA